MDHNIKCRNSEENSRPVETSNRKTSHRIPQREAASASRKKAANDREQGNAPQGRNSKRRRVRVRKVNKLRIWMSYIILIFIGISIYFVFHHRVFRIRYVRVEGNTVISDAEILTGLGEANENIFLYSRKKGENNIRKISGIKNVTLTKKIPNRLEVRVEESYILATMITNNETRYIDNNGIIRTGFDDGIMNRIRPISVELEDTIPEPGEKAFRDTEAIPFLQTLLKMDIVSNVTKVRFEKDGNIVIIYKDISVKFGKADDAAQRLSNLAAILSKIEREKIKAKEILLDEGDHPIVVTDSEQIDPMQ
ncbi:MAG: FtsQ-type POTRA domain-containing protein [Peptoniphilaceae bacterium]|nr:FtsQ-type POTRA domain-containing protein [Peptoniphilaceae bacterium]MDY3076088.1 FtsQ-type POTRA domain-containing protein [Peptoniphilaceae bacterium]